MATGGLSFAGRQAVGAALLLACGSAAAAAPPRAAKAVVTGAGLKPGEYACYGAGGRVMIGLSFKVLGAGRYTDLDGKSSGSFVVDGGTITFRGGHLDGQTGRDLKNGQFIIGAGASCGPW